jgi:molybdopterin-guanine dinucleotide biosynthesis protein MobB
MAPPVVAVVGLSSSGKTRVAASLVASLAGRGYRVAAVKHCPHGHESDRASSDTDRLYEAGAVVVAASSPGTLTTRRRVGGDPALETVVSTVGAGADIVVAEGFKSSTAPKIVVGDLPVSLENVIAHVDGKPERSDVPTYTFSQLEGLADQIRRQFLELATTTA